MKQLMIVERVCLIGHLVSMAFGLAGLLLVMPHPEFLNLVPAGQTLFRWSMAGGGVAYIIMGAIAVAIYAYRTLGLAASLAFLIPAVAISLSSELLGTGTGFPFGDYSYLSGLGYKIAGRVPFTIPLSWFYLGLSSYLLARSGLAPRSGFSASRWAWLRQLGAIALGSLLLTSWDFVLDPAMSQTALPFWYWHEPGAFFGMPYQNFAGWLATGALFMGVAALFWRRRPLAMSQAQVTLPLVVYLGNFGFATVMSLAAGYWVPILLGIILGVIPAVLCWQQSQQNAASSFLPLQGNGPEPAADVTPAPFGMPGE
ncbi:MAG: carotenoid biosynthesis protein [Synechococcales bacterium]|nr:carotenoid biosynthesis protein [Synechococcales bacterium]